MEAIKLMDYASNSGCSCKIAPQQLQQILEGNNSIVNEQLLVGNNTADDAAVYAIDDNTCIISTVDFFTPIHNDAFTYGKIAAANALSDVYAMGGTPIMATAILGWPTEQLTAETANAVIAGARSVCTEANITIAGGHSIVSKEPFFGLSVNGVVAKKNIKQNNTANIGDVLFLTKPIGLGIYTSAMKKNVLLPDDELDAVAAMSKLNNIGTLLGTCDWVTALTDVTGFGLAGHLIEMCEGANLSAAVNWNKIPMLPNLQHYIKAGIRPDATTRNWNSYGKKLKIEKEVPMMDAFTILPDPQTSGGLLIAVKAEAVEQMQLLLQQNGLENYLTPIGAFIALQEKAVIVNG
jgi:selenide, water dikinase